MSGFGELGYQVVRDIFTDDEASAFLSQILAMSGLALGSYTDVVSGRVDAFYKHGAVATNPSLCPVLLHTGLTDAIQTCLGATCRCLPGIDTAGLHHSEVEAHRDVSPGELPCLRNGIGNPDYKVARVIAYPTPGSAKFGVVAGSHKMDGNTSDILSEGPVDWRWLEVSRHDAVIFDPRAIHAGGPMTRSRAMIVLTYGTDSVGSTETYFHARIRTSGLQFPDPSPDLVAALRNQELFLEASVDPVLWERYGTIWGSGAATGLMTSLDEFVPRSDRVCP
jgi:hypothetical protein